MSPVRPQPEQEEIKIENPLLKKIETFKNIIQDCNISFLIGSGLSVPFMGTLGGIETWLTGLEEDKEIPTELKQYIKASLYKSYFDVAMKGNVEILDLNYNEDERICPTCLQPTQLIQTYEAYKDFLRIINQVLYERRSNTVNKQVNLFTTNIDVFLRK